MDFVLINHLNNHLSCPFCLGKSNFPTFEGLVQSVHQLLCEGFSCPRCDCKSVSLSDFYHHLVTHLQTQEAGKLEEEQPLLASGPCSEPSLEDLDQILNDFTEIMRTTELNDKSKPNASIKPLPPDNPIPTSTNLGHLEDGSSKVVKVNSGKSQPVPCHLCGWNFDDENFLQLHMVLMHSKKLSDSSQSITYRCPSCSSIFQEFNEYCSHLQLVHNDSRSICSLCGKMFKLKGSLLVHQRVVHTFQEGNTFQCSVCNKKFTNKYRKNIHERQHYKAKTKSSYPQNNSPLNAEERRHKCEVCLERFQTQAALILHSVSHIKERPLLNSNLTAAVNPSFEVREYKCEPCGKVFPRENHLTQHLKTHNMKQWECDICLKTFTTKYFLKKHKRLHTGETPYNCNICGKAFTFQQSFHKHMLYHTDEKPYTCSQCGRTFKELSTLQNHERIHSGERPFACETCGKSFRQRVSYLVHRRIHTGVMPYKCSTCGKSFRYKVTQRTHKCQLNDESCNPDANNTSCYPSLPQEIKKDLHKMRLSKKRDPYLGTMENCNPTPVCNQMKLLALTDEPLGPLGSIMKDVLK